MIISQTAKDFALDIVREEDENRIADVIQEAIDTELKKLQNPTGVFLNILIGKIAKPHRHQLLNLLDDMEHEQLMIQLSEKDEKIKELRQDLYDIREQYVE